MPPIQIRARRRPAPDAAAARLGEHAIVIGASMAGLLAARVLADFYDRVTVIERDALDDRLDRDRRAVPQGRHAHGLQFGGQAALEELLPGFRDESIAAGALPIAGTDELRFFAGGHLLRRVRVGSPGAVVSRPLLEGLVRRRVRALANVTVRDRCGVVGLLADGGRVVGVRTRDRVAGSGDEPRSADLVVAASGRGARVPAWLEEIGSERPAEDRVRVDVMYASRRVRLRPGALRGDKASIDGPRPDRARGVVLVAEEGDRWNVTLQGYGDRKPPSDDAGWLAFAAAVAQPDVAAALAEAELLEPVSLHAFAASVRRRCERLRRFPGGLLVMGDALCSFNPIYGQGMTVAALEAIALRDTLRGGDARLAKRFFKAAGAPVDHAWTLATGADLALPEVPDVAPLPARVVNRYMQRLMAVAAHDDEVARAFFAVASMLAAPTRLFAPAIVARVARGVPRDRPAPVAPPLTAADASARA